MQEMTFRQTFFYRVPILLVLCLSVTITLAQDEAEPVVIPYYQSTTGFNVPIPNEWENKSDERTAHFTNPTLTSQIHVTTRPETNVDEAIQNAVADQLNLTDLELLYSDQVNLADGTWTNAVFQADEVSISALGQLRGGQSFVHLFSENAPDSDYYYLVADTDSIDDLTEFVNSIGGSFENPEMVSLPIGDWEQQTSETATQLTYSFNDTQYTLLALEFTEAEEVTNVLTTHLLGYFVSPNTDAYLYLGLGATALTLIVFLFSLWWRKRNAEKDLAVIQNLSAEQQ